jgi:septum formation protein
MSSHRLILASTSPYRRDLLARLRVPFEVLAPLVNESPQIGETPKRLAERLALAKAVAIAKQHADAWVVGSDQVAELDGHIIGKPGNHTAAVAQLKNMQGRSVAFHTGVALVAPGFCKVVIETVNVQFRSLADNEIERYLLLETPYDCAGSAKSEGLGISLLEAIDSRDSTALVGLPMIALTGLLRESGYPLLEIAS